MMYRDVLGPCALPMGSGVTIGRSPVRVQRADGVGMRNRFLKRCDGGARVWARARVANAGFTRVLREVFGERHADVARGDETHLPASRGSRARREVADRWLTSRCESSPAFLTTTCCCTRGCRILDGARRAEKSPSSTRGCERRSGEIFFAVGFPDSHFSLRTPPSSRANSGRRAGRMKTPHAEELRGTSFRALFFVAAWSAFASPRRDGGSNREKPTTSFTATSHPSAFAVARCARESESADSTREKSARHLVRRKIVAGAVAKF